jgi:hypothetical protein
MGVENKVIMVNGYVARLYINRDVEILWGMDHEHLSKIQKRRIINTVRRYLRREGFMKFFHSVPGNKLLKDT